MAQNNFKAYLVVKIPKQNQNNLEKYECIPRLWVGVVDDDNNKMVVFDFPVIEDILEVKLRVITETEKNLDIKWNTLYGEVLFDNDSIDAAFRFLEGILDKIERDSEHSQNTNNKVEAITTKQIKINLIKLPTLKTPDNATLLPNTTVCSGLRKDVNLEISKAYESIRPYEDLENEDTEFSSTSKNTQVLETTKIPSNEIDNKAIKETTINDENDKKTMERPRRKSTCQKISYQEITDDESDESDSAAESEDTDSNAEFHDNPQPRTSDEIIPVGINNSLDHQDMDMNLLNLDDPVHCNLYNFYVDINESYQKMMTSFDHAANYLQKIITTSKENVEVESNLSSPVPTDDQHTEPMNSIMFSHPQPLLQERASVCDEDRKWTLRYPEKKPGTIELLPETGVYVSEKGLNECISKFNQTTKFTNALLDEVFTKKAIRKCTFTGRTRKRPGLHSKARQTLIDYVLKHALEKKWEKAELKIVANCIKNKLGRAK